VDKVLQYLQEFKPQSRAWFDEQRQVAEDYEFFREFSKRENLEKAEWRDVQQVGSHLNCFRSLALARGNALGRPNHPIERYRASFVYLVHGPEPLAERIRNFHTNDEYSLHYFGDAALSELVGYLFPEQFIFYNSRDKFSAGFLDIEPHFETGDDFVEKLVKFSQAIRPVAALYEKTIGQQTDLPLNLEVDQFLSWVYEVYSSDQNPLEAKYWVLGAGKGAKRWPEFYEDGIVTIGWDGLGDLRLYNSQSEVFDGFKTKYKDESNPTNNAKACFDFAHKLRIGDGLFVKQGTSKLVGFGVIESEYMFDESRPSHKHIRKVRWTKKGEFDLPEGERLSIKTVTPVRDAEVLEMLKKAVGLDLDEGVSVSDGHSSGVSYWWLNANPKIWNFAEDAVGQKQIYTTHNEQGNKRQKYKYFVEAKPGDLVIGYVTSPDREVVAVCKITRGIHKHPDGESIEFEKIMQLTTPVSLEELQRNPSLQESEPLVNNYGMGCSRRLTTR
jgi:5-methylcytosine-specific restriction protein B